ncbi:MAG: peptidoglycan DD-metalloendopeptidase family protein [bacterium]|nr:peptidoglycan DD-metalloendopeptidase family protein [bacterium]
MIEKLLLHTRKFLLINIMLLAILAVPAMIIAQEGTDTENLDEVRTELNDINEELAQLERERTTLHQAESLALDELNDLDRQISDLSDRIESTTTALERKRAQVDMLNASNEQALADLESARVRFSDRLVEWYKSGGGSMLGSIVSTGDLSDYVRVASYMDTIMANDQGIIGFIREQQGLLYEQTAQLQTEISEFDAMVTEMRTDEQHYEELREERYSRVSTLSTDMDVVDQSMRDLQASSYEFAMLLQASTYTGGVTGGLIKPIDFPITSPFGMRNHPIFGGERMHTGVDMPAPYGTLVHAAQAGIVVFSGWKRGYGNTIIIDHGNGLATLYGHASSLQVGVGETVSRGQVIAKVGSTGYSTGNHLHFEVRVNGDPVDPENYI